MTLQDYTSLTQESINTFFSSFGSSLGNIVAAVVILTIGIIIGYILKRILEEILKALRLEEVLKKWSPYKKVLRSHDQMDLTTFFGELLRWITIIIFLIPAMQALEILEVRLVVNSILEYVSEVILAVTYLLLGFVIGWFVHRIVQAVAILVGNNPAHLLANVAYLAIIIFAGIRALIILDITIEILRWILVAVLVASALAVGLGGRDQAMELVKKFSDKSKE